MNVVIVESPAKAKTINKYLGHEYTVLASYGHVRDLPSRDGSVRPDEVLSSRPARYDAHVRSTASKLARQERRVIAYPTNGGRELARDQADRQRLLAWRPALISAHGRAPI